MANLAAAKELGLIDMKLFVLQARSLSEAEILSGMNRIDDSLKAGECEISDRWLHDIDPQPFGPLIG
ncbi:MAG TPA: hypothetical protein VFX06_07300 [Stellaceae bacterium]|nr:hypothetical protein [Stellaceae bacterium]